MCSHISLSMTHEIYILNAHTGTSLCTAATRSERQACCFPLAGIPTAAQRSCCTGMGASPQPSQGFLSCRIPALHTAMNQGNSFSLAINGKRITGQEVRNQNVTAVLSVANVLRSSLGPLGLDKMLVDGIGDVAVTNDGATILKRLEIQHPAARMLVDLAAQQDTEVGDGTTSVVLLAAEILRRGNELVRSGNHPTTVISGFRLACREAVTFLTAHLKVSTSGGDLGRESLIQAAKTCMSSKILAPNDEFWAPLLVDALQAGRTVNSRGATRYPVNAVALLKATGGGQRDSLFIRGVALNCTVAHADMPKQTAAGAVAKIACLEMNLQRVRLHTGINVVVSDAQQLEKIRAEECAIAAAQVQRIIDAGATVVVTTRGIDDACLRQLANAGVMAVRRCTKDELRRLARATGATVVSSIGCGSDAAAIDAFDSSVLGQAAEVAQIPIGCGSHEVLVVRGTKGSDSASIVLRGASETMLDEMERSVHDVLCVLRRTLESGSVVAGGGAVEAGCSIFLERFASTVVSREQLAIAEFAQALLVIPKTLAVNAGFSDCTDLIASLRAHHNAAQGEILGGPSGKAMNASLRHYGLNVVGSLTGNERASIICDNIRHGVLEPTLIKVKSFKAATEAAISILRLDDFMKMEPEREPQEHDH